MNLEKAKEILEEEYERAKSLTYVNDPLAFAMYQAWKKIDRLTNKGGVRC